MDLTNINFLEFFLKYLPDMKPLSGDEYRARCPFHRDIENPNLTINVKKGVYYCFACGAKGNVVDFYKQFTGKTAKDFAIEYKILHIDENYVKQTIAQLEENKSIIQYLQEKRGLTLETIKKFKIGYDGERITIPIYDKYGILVNIRRYKKDADNKMISYKKGYGKLTLFPEQNLDNKTIILCAGEWDAILLNQYGFNAITVTGGEGSWNNAWDIQDKEIIIIYDCDKTGREASKKIANILFDKNKVKIIDLNLPRKGDDITDWFITYKKTKTDLIKLIDKTEWYIKQDSEYVFISLNEASKSKYYDKNISFKGLVAGKNLSPYQIPYEIELQCNKNGTLSKCALCSLAKDGYRKVVIADKKKILELIDISNSQLVGLLKKYLNIPKCGNYQIVNEAKRNVEEIKLIPEVEFTESINDEYVVRKAYYLGDNLKTNQTYVFYGTTLPDPKNQQVIHLLEKAVPSRDNIEEFRLTKDMVEKLKIFRPKKNTIKDISDKLHEIYEDLIYNITYIYNSYDLLFAYDLVFHSVLSFNFINEQVEKGWIELFVIGDTRTGKSKTIERLITHYKAGEKVTAENTTIAGLVAGLQQTQHRWTLMWGKIPLNDKRLLVIDEASGLSREDFSQLSEIRSSGIAEVVKVQIQKTKARTRLIFIANPKERRLLEYAYGVIAIKEIVGQNEDISRFDFAIGITDTDVSNKFINARHNRKIEHIYTSDLCHNLVMFAWSRKKENIIFTQEAEDRILEVAREFSTIFSKIIPLVQGAEIRIKLAKLSVALATRLYNTDETGENVIVEKAHIDYIRLFLLRIYSKTGFDYYAFSQQRKKENSLENYEQIKEIINDRLDIIELLLDNNRFTISDIENIFDIEKKEAKEILIKLIKIRAVKKYHSYYIKTPALISFLKQYKQELENQDKEEVI